jgi:cysteine-rich repeat protein
MRIRLLLWAMCFLCSFGVLAAPAVRVAHDPRPEAEATAATPDENPYLVRLPSRAFTPRGTAGVAAARADKEFVQFRRTLTSGEQEALERSGVVFHESLPPFTYLVSMDRAAAESMQRSALFLGAEPILPADKLTASLFRNEIPDHARRPDEGIAVVFRFYDDVTLDQALAALDAAGGITVSDRTVYLFANRLEAIATLDAIVAACASAQVRAAYEIPAPPVLHNTQAAGISNVPPINIAPFGLNGSGVAVGIWDAGQARPTHQDLAPRITVRDLAAPIHDHSTHVAGTICGTGATDASSKGMAPSATAFSFDFAGDILTEMTTAGKLPPVGDGIVLTSNSWGAATGWALDPSCNWIDYGSAGFGAYDNNASLLDNLVRTRRLAFVKSAGNDGTECGPAGICLQSRNTDCDGTLGSDGFRYGNVEAMSSAKNVLTVGAVEDNGTTKTDFSSCGPADDGRIKPDVVANGRNLNSTGGASDTAHLSMSGTSMATPVVSGVIALVTEEWKKLHGSRSAALNKPTPDLVKAVLVNTATDLGRPGPDYAYGHGLVKAKEAIDVLEAPNPDGGVNIAPNQVRTAFISEGETLNFRVSTPAGVPTGTVKTTVAWDDLPGSSSSLVRYCNFVNFKVACTTNADCTPFNPAGACDPAPCGAVPCNLKNDLETWLWTANFSGAYAPWVPPGVGSLTANAFQYLNHVDNVETIQASDPNGGELPLTVFGFTVTGGQQRFTLAANKKLTFLPANDNFANARALPSLLPPDPAATECPSGESPCPATLYAHNTWDSVNYDATVEAGETLLVPSAHTVWFTWVAPTSGQAVFDTAGADFDTILDAYTGNALNTLTFQGANDDFFGKQSKLVIHTVAGTTYRIRVRGVSPAGGAQDASQGVFPLNYYTIVCGNGVTEPGEACDDGNANVGDCCSPTCELQIVGDTCWVGGNQCNIGTCSGASCINIVPRVCNDSNGCTNDSCNPASGCVFANNTAPCNDGNSCTTTDTCSGGACVGGPPPAVPSGVPAIGLTTKTHGAWPPLAGATEYDVVRGSLNTLRSSGGNFATATTTCLADNQAATAFDDAGALTVGNGFFYLVRGTSCSGSGTYNTTSPKQVASRDPGVEAAPITCSTVCSRGKCTQGPPLDPQCDSCTAALCGADPFCCNTGWDGQCVMEVRTACGSLTCQESAGTCAHPVCSLGGVLTPGCDNPPMNPSCVTTICNADPYCCNTEWDGQCVGEVGLCGWNCN